MYRMYCLYCRLYRTAPQGRAIFASGSPQGDFEYQGKMCAASQANNM